MVQSYTHWMLRFNEVQYLTRFQLGPIIDITTSYHFLSAYFMHQVPG